MAYQELRAADATLAKALATLGRVSRKRRTLRTGSPEDKAARDEEERLCSKIYRLAVVDRH